jgi:hypothetical protein
MSLESNMKRSVIGSSSSAYDEHEPPGVDHTSSTDTFFQCRLIECEGNS